MNNELYHYGVKGMKWGVHRANYGYNGTASSKRYKYEQANREYRKSFNKAYSRSISAFSPIKKHRQNNANRWNDATAKGQAAIKARGEYKQAVANAKKVRKNTLNEVRSDIKSNRTAWKAAKQKAKIDKGYKNSAEYKQAKVNRSRDVANRLIYGKAGREKIGALKKAGYTDKGAKFMTVISGQNLKYSQLEIGLDYDRLAERQLRK